MNIVIVGAGDIGRYIAGLLSKEQHNVIVVEKDKDKLDELSRNIDVGVRQGSGTDWQLLDDLMELHPDVIIALTAEDPTNLVVCSIAKHLGYPQTIARIRDTKYLNRTRLDFGKVFDVDYFIGPEILVAHDMYKYMQSEGALILEHFAHGAVQLRTIAIPQFWKKSEKKLRDLDLPNGIIIGLIKRNEKVIFPHGDDVIMPKDEVTLIGETDAIIEAQTYFGIKSKKVDSVVIVGGSVTGMHLARLLQRKHINVRIIDKDYERCVYLAEQLPETTIIHHDAIDLNFLKAEKMGQADVFAACTRHDEVNMMAALLAREAGCQDTLIMLSNTESAPMTARLGINHVLSPRAAAANRILSHLLSGTVTSLVSLYENQAEVMEIMVSMDSRVAGIPLSDLGPLLPKDFLIAIIQNRGRLMVANGDRIISPGDTVIVITAPQHIPEIETIF